MRAMITHPSIVKSRSWLIKSVLAGSVALLVILLTQANFLQLGALQRLEVSGAVTTTAHLSYHARIVASAATLRRLIGEATSIVEEAHQTRPEVDAVRSLLDEAETVLRAAGPWFPGLGIYMRAMLAVQRSDPDDSQGESCYPDAATSGTLEWRHDGLRGFGASLQHSIEVHPAGGGPMMRFQDTCVAPPPLKNRSACPWPVSLTASCTSPFGTLY